ncbi:hypothetical protein [Streptomyces flavofungini]|uniref:Uncharacterized protein n=1 Tax=Streptomyces flavofungini TaxID=68200 RepID=A0ABS0XIG1_9ACTN|nr:hypothetical protein [Streptomyces flavofungini]MBJ3813003.1 hypothetical protein [Streptomyces flavofungini]
MSERTGAKIVLALALATLVALTGVSTGALDDLDASPRDGRRQFVFDGTRLSVVVHGDGRARLRYGKKNEVTVTRKLTGAAAKKGNSSWSLEDQVLRLFARCTGIAINCSVEYVVHLPPDVDVFVSASPGVTIMDLNGAQQTCDVEV